MSSDTLSPRPLRLSQKILGRLGKIGDREKDQAIPFRGVHTPDRPENPITPIEAPSEQECSDRIASWHRAVLEDDRFDKDKESWIDWTSDTESNYSDEEKDKEVQVEVNQSQGKGGHEVDDTTNQTTLEEVLSPLLDDRFSYGGASACSPQLRQAEQLEYRKDFRQVSHHPLLARTRYEPEQLRQTYAEEEGASRDTKGKDRSGLARPVPPRSAARLFQSVPRSTPDKYRFPTPPPDRQTKRESPPGAISGQRNASTPEPNQPKLKLEQYHPALCPHCKKYDLTRHNILNHRSAPPPLTCPGCHKGLTTFPGTLIPPPPLKQRKLLTVYPIAPVRSSAKQRLDDSLRRLRTPTPPPGHDPPNSPVPTIWPAPSNLRPRQQQQQQKSGNNLPPLSAPPPATPLPVIPARKQAPSGSGIREQRKQQHIMDAYYNQTTTRNSGTFSGSSQTGSPAGRASSHGNQRSQKSQRTASPAPVVPSRGGGPSLPIHRSKFYQSSDGNSDSTRKPNPMPVAGSDQISREWGSGQGSGRLKRGENRDEGDVIDAILASYGGDGGDDNGKVDTWI
ncbi:hypothetical protein QBC43DRAFT_352603 [Cladorrhinum sp. PSN259]|nr:hypothetical protein QBC43DRAFT_352603 [Cladorrhinum sp. PSN259]